jgi:hypothetical protein
MSTLLPWHHPHAQVLTATMPDGIRGARHGGPVVGTMPDSIEEQLVQRWTSSRRVVVATIPYSLEQSSSGAVSNIAIFSIVLYALCLIITGSVMCIVINVRAYLMLNFFICSSSILTIANLNFLTMCFLCFVVSLRAENYVFAVLLVETDGHSIPA